MGIDIYADKMDPNFLQQQNWKEVPHRGCWQLFYWVLVGTVLITHTWLTNCLGKQWIFVSTQATKCLYMIYASQCNCNQYSNLKMILLYYLEVLAIWCKSSHHVPCWCSLEFHLDFINLLHVVLLSLSQALLFPLDLNNKKCFLLFQYLHYCSLTPLKNFPIVISIAKAHINFKQSHSDLIKCPPCLLHLYHECGCTLTLFHLQCSWGKFLEN